MVSERLELLEASIGELRAALDAGLLTCVELVACYLNRIACYDRHGICLNAVPVLNPELFADAHAADERRRRGGCRGPLDGIPYLVKASYAVKGMPLTSGSPAFEQLVAGADAFVVGALRDAGAVLIGITNMPPMAAGGMQRGLYGRAESPYNAGYLTAAYASGSSNGSGSGLAANFAAFALAEETWSSGRAPASNNGLVAYTPSRGVISVRGNWPLIPTMDVVVPYARSVSDLFEVLNVIVADDAVTRGDFWRMQDAVTIPPASAVRPVDYTTLADRAALAGKRIGVPRMYINEDDVTEKPIATRSSVISLWQAAARDLEALGAEVIAVDFPLVSNYECDRPGARSMVKRGLVPKEFARAEGWDAIVFAWDDFLAANADANLHTLAGVDGRLIIPRIPGAVPDRYEGIPNFAEYPAVARNGVTPLADIPHLAEGLRGLEETRRCDFDEWLETQGLDILVFPAVADIAPADADYNPRSSDVAWRNGTWVANGNQAIRHFGLPTVTVPMGLLEDIAMPVGLTFVGRAYDDLTLLRSAWAFEQSGARRRAPPPRTPARPGEVFERTGAAPRSMQGSEPCLAFEADVSPVADDGCVVIRVRGRVDNAGQGAQIGVWVNGDSVAVHRDGVIFEAAVTLPYTVHYTLHSRWRGPYGSIVTVLARAATGQCAAAYRVVGGVA